MMILDSLSSFSFSFNFSFAYLFLFVCDFILGLLQTSLCQIMRMMFMNVSKPTTLQQIASREENVFFPGKHPSNHIERLYQSPLRLLFNSEINHFA